MPLSGAACCKRAVACNSEHELAKKKAAGQIPATFVQIWLPTVDTLRNFFLTPPEMFGGIQQLGDVVGPFRSKWFRL